MAELATVTSAPAGTQKKIAPGQVWVAAAVGDVLTDQDEIQNINNNDYGVSLLPGGMIGFGQTCSVSLNSVTGDVRFQDTTGQWIPAGGPGQYTVMGVGVSPIPGGGTQVVCRAGGKLRVTPGW